MFITPYFGGCKYTNKFLFINKNIVFQHFVLLITSPAVPPEAIPDSTLTPGSFLDATDRETVSTTVI